MTSSNTMAAISWAESFVGGLRVGKARYIHDWKQKLALKEKRNVIWR